MQDILDDPIPIPRDQSRARVGEGAINESQIDIQIRDPQVIRNDIENPPQSMEDDALRAANKHEYKFGVRALMITIIITAIIVTSLSAGIMYFIVQKKGTDSSLQNQKDNIMEISADMAKSISVGNIYTMCENWGPNYLYLNRSSCSGCSGQILNAQCPLCIYYYKSSLNILVRSGSSCSGCNLTSSKGIGYCSYCKICSPEVKIIQCLDIGTYTYKSLQLNYASCTGCSGCVGCSDQQCAFCTDTNNSTKTASSCYTCYIVSNGKGSCDGCRKCLY